MKEVFHLVSGNGLGHFKRTIEIWEELIDNLAVNVTIVSEKWQHDKWSNNRSLIKSNNHTRIKFHYLDLTNTLQWHESHCLTFEQYQLTWEKIKALKCFRDADLVISDNLLGVIGSNKKVIIIGSFLWHDVLRQSIGANIDERVFQREDSLLKNSMTKIVSIKDITMPALQRRNENIGLDWFCSDVYDRPIKARKHYKILFSVGLSGAHTAALSALIGEFANSPKYSIYLSPALAEKTSMEGQSYAIFDFEEDSFKSLDLMVARPGVGALTEAIKYQIPMLAVDNGNNSEMLFNAMRLEQLGYGWDCISRIPTLKELEQDYQSKLQALKTCKVNGFKDLEKILKDSIGI